MRFYHDTERVGYADQKQKSAPACWRCKSHSPQKNSWLALRAAREKNARMGGNFRSSAVLVRHIDLSWNTLEPSLVLMYQKLIDLGWVYYNGEIHIVEPETEESQHHV